MLRSENLTSVEKENTLKKKKTKRQQILTKYKTLAGCRNLSRQIRTFWRPHHGSPRVWFDRSLYLILRENLT